MKLRIPITFLLTAALAMPAELPVKQVVLYKHGVGYFERSGRLAAGESARLDFNAAEMNDVLKSLTLEERGGGKITGLRYDSMDPLSHKLSEFPFQIGGGGMPGMLDQLKGARIELKFGNETVAGTIVSARTIPGNDRSRSTTRSTCCWIRASFARSIWAPPPASASPIPRCSSSSATISPPWPPPAPRTSAASTSIPPTRRNAR